MTKIINHKWVSKSVLFYFFVKGKDTQSFQKLSVWPLSAMWTHCRFTALLLLISFFVLLFLSHGGQAQFGPTDPVLLSAALNINTLLRGPVNTWYWDPAMNVRTNLRTSPMRLRMANGAAQEEKCKRDPCKGKGKGFAMTSHSCNWFWLYFYRTLKLLHYNNVFHFQQVFIFTQNRDWRQLSSFLSFSFTSSSKWLFMMCLFQRSG